MHLIDTHCHVDLYPDYKKIIAEAERLQIETIAVTTTPSVYSRCVELTKASRLVHPAIGLHPELVANRHRELSVFVDLIHETRFVGEVGLDYCTKDEEERRLQRCVFGHILEVCARSGDKILTIHSRRAAAEVVAMIGPSFPGTAILHWFTGSAATARDALSYGLYFSVNPTMPASARGRELLRLLPRDRVLTETDGPFVIINGVPARPPDVYTVLERLADCWGISIKDAAVVVSRNYCRAMNAVSSS